MSHTNTADKLLIRPTHGDRAGAGNGANKSHSTHPNQGAGQFSGHASVTDANLTPGATGPVNPTHSQSVLAARHPTSHPRSTSPAGRRTI